MKNLAIIRGGSLNKWEMQNYEPLRQWFNLVAFATHNRFDTTELDMNIRYLNQIEDKYPKFLFRAIGITGYLSNLCDELKNFDVINVAETYHAYSAQAIRAKKKYGCKVVVTCWENIPRFCEWYPYPIFQLNLKSKIKRYVRKHADMFIAITNKAKDALLIEGVKESKIKVIPMGVDINRFKPRQKQECEKFIILFVGRMVKQKGIFYLAQAIPKVYLKNPNIECWLVGEGKDKPKLQEFISLHLTKYKHLFKFLPPVPYNQVHEIYNQANILVLPSYSIRSWQEQFGMVLVEAMASGLPVISTLSGSIPEVIGTGENEGLELLVPEKDSSRMAEKIIQIMENEELYKKLSNYCRKRAERLFDKDKVALKLKEAFEECLFQ